MDVKETSSYSSMFILAVKHQITVIFLFFSFLFSSVVLKVKSRDLSILARALLLRSSFVGGNISCIAQVGLFLDSFLSLPSTENVLAGFSLSPL